MRRKPRRQGRYDTRIGARRVGLALFVRYTFMSQKNSGVPESPGPESRALTGAEVAYAKELFERHRLSLYRYLKGLLHSREDASDIVQESYLRLLRQPGFEHIRNNVRAYLFQTATNLARDRFRQRAHKGLEAESEVFLAGGLDTPDWTTWPELALEGEQLTAIVTNALEELDGSVRASLLLHRFRGLTHREIAAFMGVSERTIERHIKEGLTHIAARLEAAL
jgi:RNA polymerase sigma factor (sigma-70 family)